MTRSDSPLRPGVHSTERFSVVRLAGLPGTYFHAVDLTNGFVCNNLRVAGGKLYSPDCLALLEPGGLGSAHTSLRDTPIEILRHTPPPGVVTPRSAQVISVAALRRRGTPVWQGDRLLPYEDRGSELRISEQEVAFESVRRRVAPQAASRLSCLWVAEDSDAGRENIAAMMEEEEELGTPPRHVVRVRVPCALRFTRVDVAWWDAVVWQADERIVEDCAVQYWSGRARKPEAPRWEWLVEGVIELVDSIDFEVVQRDGARLG